KLLRDNAHGRLRYIRSFLADLPNGERDFSPIWRPPAPAVTLTVFHLHSLCFAAGRPPSFLTIIECARISCGGFGHGQAAALFGAARASANVGAGRREGRCQTGADRGEGDAGGTIAGAATTRRPRTRRQSRGAGALEDAARSG